MENSSTLNTEALSFLIKAIILCSVAPKRAGGAASSLLWLCMAVSVDVNGDVGVGVAVAWLRNSLQLSSIAVHVALQVAAPFQPAQRTSLPSSASTS